MRPLFEMRTRLIVLPGMDGTAVLRDAFRRALETRFDVDVLAYPATSGSYLELGEHVARSLPDDAPYVLIGESFGGPLAVMLAARRQSDLRGLCLCASFVRYPVRFGALASLTSLLPFKLVPSAVTAALMYGPWSTPSLRSALTDSVAPIPHRILAARARAAATIDVSDLLRDSPTPLLYIRATHDRVVSAAAARTIARLRPDARIQEIAGPHGVLQARAQPCAQAIAAWVRSN
jgi:pimeloyl-ACP methyl ester carboxylesterase